MAQEASPDFSDMLSALTRMQPKVRDNTEIIAKDDLPYPMLHISQGRQSILTPNISRRAGMKEDNTVARIHAAPHLHGCIVGYGSALDNTLFALPGKSSSLSSGKNVAYKGGYYIHAIPFELALKPNAKLVFDAKVTDETWLVTYNDKTVQYPCTVVGKVFPRRVISTPVWQGDSVVVTEYYVEVTNAQGIALTNKQALSTGYHKIVHNHTTHKYTSSLINKQVYDFEKQQSASTLGYSEEKLKPSKPYLNW